MRKLFKTIVSVILSITFIFSYLNVITNDVSAASGSMVEEQTYTCPSDNYSYEFSPVQTGYYFLESTAWADVYCTTYGYEDHIDSVNFIPIGLDSVISEDSIREVYYTDSIRPRRCPWPDQRPRPRRPGLPPQPRGCTKAIAKR